MECRIGRYGCPALHRASTRPALSAPWRRCRLCPPHEPQPRPVAPRPRNRGRPGGRPEVDVRDDVQATARRQSPRTGWPRRPLPPAASPATGRSSRLTRLRRHPNHNAKRRRGTRRARCSLRRRDILQVPRRLLRYHETIEAILRLKERNGIAAQDVDGIRLTVPAGTSSMCNIQEQTRRSKASSACGSQPHSPSSRGRPRSRRSPQPPSANLSSSRSAIASQSSRAPAAPTGTALRGDHARRWPHTEESVDLNISPPTWTSMGAPGCCS
jgi:hypothetical protein